MLLAAMVLAALLNGDVAAEPDEWGKGPTTIRVENDAGRSVEVRCGGAAILDHRLHPTRRFVLLDCYGGKHLELFQRLIDLRTGLAVKLSFGSFSPAGGYGVFKRWPQSMWHPLQLVPLRQLHRYVRSGGRAGAIVVGKPPPSRCPFAVELDRWMADDILRYALAACGTDDLFDYCASQRRTLPVARALDGSDTGRARRKRQPPIPSPCPDDAKAATQ